jgi:hypothetical protein
MRVCCPVCDTEFPVEAGFAEADGKRLAAVLAGLDGVLGRTLLGYLRLWKPAKTQLRVAKAVKIAQEVAALVDTGEVRRGGIGRPATSIMWAAGIEQMLGSRDKLRLPLTSHGYLIEVVFGMADRVDAAQERSQEQNLRKGDRREAPPPAAASKLQSELEAIDQFERLGGLTPEEADRRRNEAREKYGAQR